MCNFVITGVAVVRALGNEAFITHINSVLFAISLHIRFVVIIYNFIIMSLIFSVVSALPWRFIVLLLGHQMSL